MPWSALRFFVVLIGCARGSSLAGLCFALSLVALTSVALTSKVKAFCQLTTEAPATGECVADGIGLAWERQCISYTLVPMPSGSLQTDEVRDAINRSFMAWTNVQCGGEPLALELGQTVELGECLHAEYNRFGPNANTIMFLDDWEGEDFPPTAFGLTLVWHDPNTGRILDADMQLNETLGPIEICGAACDSDLAVDLENVVTHEAGHFLGLGHSLVTDSTMVANAGLGETTNRSLESDDEQGICSIYASNPTPVCRRSDFQPDHGFTPMCGEPITTGEGCAATVVGAHTSGSDRTRATLAALGLALLGLALSRRRARR